VPVVGYVLIGLVAAVLGIAGTSWRREHRRQGGK
jgi:hypothetical protein